MPSRSASRPRKSDSTVVELPVTPKAVKATAARDRKQEPTSEKPAKKKSSTSKKAAIGTPDEIVAKAVATDADKEVAAAPSEANVMSFESKPATSLAKPEPAKKPAARRKSADSSSPRKGAKGAQPEGQVSHEQRLQYIAEAAYYIAERRGFAPGFEHQNWVEAEAEVNERLRTSGAPPKSDDETE